MDDDNLEFLIGLGVVVLLVGGLYLVLKSFSDVKEGDKITKDDIKRILKPKLGLEENKIAYIRNWHDVFDVDGNKIGFIKNWRNMFNSERKPVGSIRNYNEILDVSGNQIGFVKKMGSELYDMEGNLMAFRRNFWDMFSSNGCSFDFSDYRDLTLVLGFAAVIADYNNDDYD